LRSGDTEGFRRWWAITTALGALFLVGQFAAWRQLAAQGVFLVTNPSSSFFYLLTALHGLHLLGGIVALLYVTYRPWQRSRITQSTAADLVSIYWHFMDGLWIFLFALLYLGR
jgi:cytochrome c oxidase subunit III